MVTKKEEEAFFNAKRHTAETTIREVCLDPREPCARTYNDRDMTEQVTVPDLSMSLSQMVMTGNVGVMPGANPAYSDPDLGDDDEAHEHPDYEKLNKMDIVDKENYVTEWETRPENYEKEEEPSSKVDAEEKGAAKEADKEVP